MGRTKKELKGLRCQMKKRRQKTQARDSGTAKRRRQSRKRIWKIG